MSDAVHGDGYAVSHLDRMGDGYGFRKVRHAIGVTAFGINALVIPPGFATGVHFHEAQEETYFVHAGEVEFRFGASGRESTHVLTAGGVARVDPETHRGLRNVGSGDAIILVAGGRDGYVGRDGHAVGRDPDAPGPPGAPA